MRISDKIANDILTDLEDRYNIKISKSKHLNIECMIADNITQCFNKWLNYDVDLNQDTI